jgi:hypothetical protein
VDFDNHGGSSPHRYEWMIVFDLVISEASDILVVGRSVATIVSLLFYGAILQKPLPL